MSEERFDRIEQRLDRLETGQDALRTDVGGLKTDVACLKTDVAGLKTGQDDLRREMRVMHEEVIDRIKAIADPVPRIERLLDAKIDGLREEIGRRLDPLEAAVRRHLGT